jgi:2-dehydro-3-deoxygluconokinase
VTRVLCVGECMVELRRLDAVTMRLGYAGDTYNTAVYLRRVADELGMDVEVGYLTGLGDDEYSEGMRAAWASQGVLDRSLTVEGCLPGLYTIRVDDRGERRFAYWRSASAARRLFGGTAWVDYLDGDVIHLSGVTLQLTSPEAHEVLLHRLRELRGHGARISLDTNYRPSGWTSPEEAARVMDQISQVASIALATWEDEAAMHHCRAPMDCAVRLAAQGVPEVVVKSGANGAHLLVDGHLQHIPAAPAEQVVDTTAAGDSFAGAYLAARINGRSPLDAARIAVEVAAVVVGHSGAILPADVSLEIAVSRAIGRPRPSPP